MTIPQDFASGISTGLIQANPGKSAQTLSGSEGFYVQIASIFFTAALQMFLKPIPLQQGPGLLKQEDSYQQAIITPETVIPLFGEGICGITPRAGAVVAGVYMILMTNMYLIFEFRHLSLALAELARHKIKGLARILPYCYYTAIVLAFITYPVCLYYLYCVYHKKTIGFYVYFVWIIFYDAANITIVILTSQIGRLTAFSISPLEWFGVATRIPVDCFWLCFIVTYAMVLIEGRSSGRMRQRRTSRHVSEPPKFRLGASGKRVQW